MAAVIFSPRSKRDLREIGDYVANDDPNRAEAFVEKLLEACLDLGEFPRRFPPAPRFGPDAHKRTVGNYLIIYDVRDDLVEVTTVRHAKRS